MLDVQQTTCLLVVTCLCKPNEYFYSNTNQMHQFLKFILFCSSTLHVSEVSPPVIRSLRLYIQHQVYVIQFSWLLASGNSMELQFQLVPASKQSAESVWHTPDAVCTVLDSWWWTERPSETCRMLLQNKINLRNWSPRWFYYRNISRCTAL